VSEPTGFSDRAARAGSNEALFRSVNERVEELHESLPADGEYEEFICECANESCFEPIRVSLSEYEAVRAHEARFAVAPSEEHLVAGVEEVVEHGERFWVVEKLGAARVVAAETDPRGDETA
jgi:hypothetical protein